MNFSAIGRIGTYARQQNLLFAADYRIKTGQRVVDEHGNLDFAQTSMFDSVFQAKQKSDSEVNAAKMAIIKQKLRSGRKLSSEEMNYLRTKDPKTYKKAKHAEEAREDLKAALKQATTKAEARQAYTEAIIKAAAEATAELAALKEGAAGGGVGAGMDLPTPEGDMSMVGTGIEGIEEGVGLDAEGLVSANGEIAEESQAATSEISEATGEEISEASSQQSESAQNTEHTSSPFDDDKDSEWDIIDKFIITIRALEDEWRNFTKSDEYDELPEDLFEAMDFARDHDKKPKNRNKLLDSPDWKQMSVTNAYREVMNNWSNL